MSLKGKNVLVTGAARGIGAATARELAQRGARVGVIGLEPDRLRALAAELGDGHVAIEADVTDVAAIGSAISDAVSAFGGLDVVVANAGVANFGTIHSAGPEAFARTIDVNVNGVYRTLWAARPHLAARKGYALIVASLASFTPLPGGAAYAASKAAVASLADTLRLELLADGIAVGTAHPSWVDTDMVREAERALPGFAALRARLPWPANRMVSTERCAMALADAVERRARRVFVPRSGRLVAAARSLVASRAGERVVASRTDGLARPVEGDA